MSKDALDFYKSTGILHQTSPRYTPGLNGVVERFNRTVKAMTVVMIDDTRLGHAFWDFVAKYAVMTINKTSTGGGGVCAWTVITGRSSNIMSIREFGDLCFVHIPGAIRTKANCETQGV